MYVRKGNEHPTYTPHGMWHSFTFTYLTFSGTTWIRKVEPFRFWILMRQETIGGAGISWTKSKTFANYARIAVYSVFTGQIFFRLTSCESTVSKL